MNHPKIALTFSGGGYRAATFHLGALSMLNHVKLTDGSTLLDHVEVLSTVSGGTITGLRYMLARTQGQPVEEMERELYDFLTSVDLITQAVRRIADKKEDHHVSIIRTMADIYDEQLFGGARMGELMDNVKRIPVNHFSANATDFSFALPFRFQVTDDVSRTGSYGVVGNKELRIPREVACHIRLADALACSSCAPIGFEPMMFPSDFRLQETEAVAQYKEANKPFGIMDGGIVDNQGIQPVILAEQRMKKGSKETVGNVTDLVIVSDVATPYMDDYTPVENTLPRWLSHLTLKKINRCFRYTEIVLTAVLALCIFFAPKWVTSIAAVLWTLTTLLHVGFAFGKKKIYSALRKTIVQHSIRELLSLNIGEIFQLLANRATSTAKMVSSVFLKHIRRLEYDTLYEDSRWRNRLIMNGLYELRAGEKWEKKQKTGVLPKVLTPTQKMQETSEAAANMGTTLWFTDEEKAAALPQQVWAAGQYTLCYNLLEYIHKLKTDPTNTNEHHALIVACEPQLMEAWTKFQENPLWMVEERLS